MTDFIEDYENDQPDAISICKLIKEGQTIAASMKLPSDIRFGWLKAKEEGKLQSCGIYPVPLHVIEESADCLNRVLIMACPENIKHRTKDVDGYIEDMKWQISLLEKQCEAKDKQMYKKDQQISALIDKITRKKKKKKIKNEDNFGLDALKE